MHKRGIMSKYTIQKIILKRKKNSVLFAGLLLRGYCCYNGSLNSAWRKGGLIVMDVP